MFVALKLQDGKIWPNRFCRPDVQARWTAPVYTVMQTAQSHQSIYEHI